MTIRSTPLTSDDIEDNLQSALAQAAAVIVLGVLLLLVRCKPRRLHVRAYA